MASPTVYRRRAKLANTARFYPDDVEALEAQRRDLKAARAEDLIREIVDSAPPLTVEQRDHLAELLRGAA